MHRDCGRLAVVGLGHPGRVLASWTLRPVDGQALAQMRTGMNMDEVAAQPLARGGPQWRDYMVADSHGLNVASIWFNNEPCLWMGKGFNPQAPGAFAILSTRPPLLPPTRPLTLSASQLFKFGSAELRAGQPELDGLLRAFALSFAGQRLVVTGHTDGPGAQALKGALSLRRAEPVANCHGCRAALTACLAANRQVIIESTLASRRRC